jgi:D-lactate dehydrogenase (cytochrome)
VGGRVAFGGIILATEKLNLIKNVNEGYAVAEAGVVLSDFQQAVEREGMLYPPDPTERGCFLGAQSQLMLPALEHSSTVQRETTFNV